MTKTLSPTSRPTADQAHARLVSDILRGTYPPRTVLPPERDLAELLGMSKAAVRDAIKRLEAMHMVRVTHDMGTEVLDYQQTCGIDLLEAMSHHILDFAALAQHWLSVLEMRAALSADIARLCALRASPELRRKIVQLREHMLITTDENALYALSGGLWDCLITGSGNLAYRLSLNSMLRSMQSNPAMAMQWCVAEMRLTNFHEALIKAIASGDADAAEADVRTMMRNGLAIYEQRVATAKAMAQASAQTAAQPAA
jgi:GntR family transcriptional repressor for pyruvate dehydrogenase complex